MAQSRKAAQPKPSSQSTQMIRITLMKTNSFTGEPIPNVYFEEEGRIYPNPSPVGVTLCPEYCDDSEEYYKQITQPTLSR